MWKWLRIVLLLAIFFSACGGDKKPNNVDGENPPPGIDGENPPPSTDGENPPPGTDGENPPPGTDGENPPPGTDGENPPPGTDNENPPATVTQVEAPPQWSINVGDFESNMTTVISVDIVGKTQYGPNDMLAAFVNDQLRGVITPQQVDETSPSLFFLTIHSNRTSGEQVRFRLYDTQEQQIYTLGQHLDFVVDSHHGSIETPLDLVADSIAPNEE